MRPNVMMLLGINGVGKSTLTKKVRQTVPECAAISGSETLMKAFGGADRVRLEAMSAGEKMRMMEPAFLDAFERCRNAPSAILDTHLVVPIRCGRVELFENIWSDLYAPYIRSAIFVAGDPKQIRERRIRDELETGRKRDTDIRNIRVDQAMNLRAFDDLASSIRSWVVVNDDLEETARIIISRLLSDHASD